MADDLAAQTLLEEKLADYRRRNVTRIKLGLTDVDGVIRGKYVNLGKFASLMAKGGGMCDCVFGWDVNDRLYETAYTGWHSGFPDAAYRLVAASERWLEDERCPYFIGEFVAPDGGAHPICPRTRLKHLLGRLDAAGMRLFAGFEYEFFVFSETAWSVRDKGYRDMRPLTPGNFGYSVLRSSTEADRFGGLMDYCASLGCPIEGLHCETGPGVWEAALVACEGLEAADRANLFKTFAKVFFARQELLATFMAKWSMNYPGLGGHLHFSLLDANGTNLFHEGSAPHAMSALHRQAVGGLVKYLPEYLALLAPTVNSYTRLVKGAWAPTASTWGVENRTSAIRVIGGSPGSQRVECRVGGADANPYLVAAAVVAATLHGIDEDLDPGPAVTGNAYDVQATLPAERQFPGQLRAAAERLNGSCAARSMLGDAFVDHFVTSRLWESGEHERFVDSWQLERYFEII